MLSWTTFRRGYFPEYPPPHTIVALEFAEGPLFISSPIDLEPTALREGMTLVLRWTDGANKLGEYNLSVHSARYGPSPCGTLGPSWAGVRTVRWSSRPTFPQ